MKLYCAHCTSACQDQNVLPTKQIKIDLNVHEYKWFNPVIMNCLECLEAQWFVITSIIYKYCDPKATHPLFKRSEVSKIPCKWSEKMKRRSALICTKHLTHHQQWVTPARAWFIVWPDWMYKSLRDKMGLVRSERDRGAQHNIICSSIIMASYLAGQRMAVCCSTKVKKS